MVLVIPFFQNGNAQCFEHVSVLVIEIYLNINNHDQDEDVNEVDAGGQNIQMNMSDNVIDDWFEEEVELYINSCLALSRHKLSFSFLHTVVQAIQFMFEFYFNSSWFWSLSVSSLK